MTPQPAPARLAFAHPPDGSLELALSGTWHVASPVPDVALVRHAIEDMAPHQIVFDTGEVVAWDSALVAFAARIGELGVAVDRSGLPPGVRRLLALAEVTPRQPPAAPKPPPAWVARVGTRAIARGEGAIGVVRWIGEIAIALGRLLVGRARVPWRDVFLQMELTGARALGIVSLVAALFGLILAFVGGVQLRKFGATVYVADLVSVGMVREMGAMMTAIIVAGRTGAAFAAELGSMRVSQEIEAFTTLSISPVEYLVLPRVIALTLMMPLLCVYADLVGIVGGAIVGIGAMGLEPRVYFDQTIKAASIGDLAGGLFKATTYGVLIGAASCREGLRAGRTAAAVGKAATSAVVNSIVLVIAMCGLFSVVFYELGI